METIQNVNLENNIPNSKKVLSEILDNIRLLKNIDFNEDFKYENIILLKNLCNQDGFNIFENFKLFLCLENLKETDQIINWMDYLVCNSVLELIKNNDVAAATIVALLKNQVEPNYNILPKIFASGKIKYTKLVDLLFGLANPMIKPVMIIEYFRQNELKLDRVILLLIKTKVLEWFKKFEPKSIEWCANFLKVESEQEFDFKIEVEKLENFLK